MTFPRLSTSVARVLSMSVAGAVALLQVRLDELLTLCVTGVSVLLSASMSFCCALIVALNAAFVVFSSATVSLWVSSTWRNALVISVARFSKLAYRLA